jgi:hypothetical protein
MLLYMKKTSVSVAFSCLFLLSQGQNIGINTTSPQASFDVKGNYRVGGATRYMTFDTLTGSLHVRVGSAGVTPFSPSAFVAESSNHTYLSLLSMSASGFESGIIFGNESSNASGSIIYGNSFTPNGFQFRNNGNQIRMVLDNAGRLGINVSNPAFKLDVNGDMRLTGPLALNADKGSAGQVIQSNGPTSAPSWVSSSNILYNNTDMVTGTVITVPAFQSLFIPGLSYAFTIPGNAKVLLTFNVRVNPPSCLACGNSEAALEIVSDGNHLRAFVQYVPNGANGMLSGSHLIVYGPGTHSIQILATAYYHDVTFGSPDGALFQDTMTIQVIPQ